MYCSRWGDLLDRGGRGTRGGTYADRMRFGNMSPEERREQMKQRKLQFDTKLALENLRRQMSKGGEIVTIMKEKEEGGNNISQMDVAKLLKSSGFNGNDIEGISFNPYREGQVEVQFKKETRVDYSKIEQALVEGKYKLEIAPFDHIEEVVIIRGLPLTDDIKGMEEKIKEAIQPFVKEVKRMEACKHREGNRNVTEVEEFFKNKYNGMWRVVVEPKEKSYIPNYIVIGKGEKVQGQVQYRKKYGARPEMCSDCYSEEHFRRSNECMGVVDWDEYCERFELIWNEESRKANLPMKRSNYVGELEERIKKLAKDNEDLVKAAEEVENSKQMEENLLRMQKEKDDMYIKNHLQEQEMHIVKEKS